MKMKKLNEWKNVDANFVGGGLKAIPAILACDVAQNDFRYRPCLWRTWAMLNVRVYGVGKEVRLLGEPKL